MTSAPRPRTRRMRRFSAQKIRGVPANQNRLSRESGRSGLDLRFRAPSAAGLRADRAEMGSAVRKERARYLRTVSRRSVYAAWDCTATACGSRVSSASACSQSISGDPAGHPRSVQSSYALTAIASCSGLDGESPSRGSCVAVPIGFFIVPPGSISCLLTDAPGFRYPTVFARPHSDLCANNERETTLLIVERAIARGRSHGSLQSSAVACYVLAFRHARNE